MPFRRPRRALVAVPTAAAVALALLTVGPLVGAEAVPSAGALAEAQQEERRLQGAVGSAEQELAAVEARLEVLQVRLVEAGELLAVAEEALAAADREAQAAADQVAHTEKDLAAARTEFEDNQQVLGQIARDTYKYGLPATSPAIAVIETIGAQGTDEGFADRLHYLQRGLGSRTVALEASVALSTRIDHLLQRSRAEQAEQDRLLAVAGQRQGEAATAHAEVELLTSETGAELDRSIALVAELEQQQVQVQQQVVQLEAQVAREIEEERLARERAEREARERAEREAREREAREQAARDRAARERADRERADRERADRERREREAARSSSGGSSSGGSGGSSSGGSGGSSSGGSGGSSSGGSGGGSGSSGGGSVSVGAPSGGLTRVGGITVASSLAPQLEALLNAARADGIVLGGSGYRSPEVQARLRIANGCPDVYTAPASSCRVPTAAPGRSEHERGLAVDFTYRGQTICYPRSASSCHGNAAFDWLRANAHRFGLRNLPAEAWHWSTTGR